MWELVPKYCTIARLRAKSHSVARKINSMRSVFSEVYYLRWFIVQWPVAKTGTTAVTQLSYFTFPTDKRLSKWLKVYRLADNKFAEEATKARAGENNNLRICSAHFHPSTYRKTLRGIRKTNGTALPTIF